MRSLGGPSSNMTDKKKRLNYRHTKEIPCEDTGRSYTSNPQAKEKDIRRNPPCKHLDLELLGSETMRI